MKLCRQTGRQHQGVDRPGVRQVPGGSGEQEKWRKLVAKSSVVPQRPSRLRDDDDDGGDDDVEDDNEPRKSDRKCTPLMIRREKKEFFFLKLF